MKKIVVIFAAMAAVLSSCSKNEMESVSANEIKDIVLNISVSNPGADDTKALIKTGWAKDDEISIWFNDRTGEKPDLVIKYDGSKWTQKETPSYVPTSGNGYVKAVYSGNVIVASKDNYTIEDEILTFSIEHWTFLTEIQVVVTGLTYDHDKVYSLSCDKFTPISGVGYTVGSEVITAKLGTKGKGAKGISNTDGVAFAFATADYSAIEADYKFTLKNLLSDDDDALEYTATTAKISDASGHSTIKALTIASSKFAAAVPEYVVMKMGKEATYTLKWATMNLGATTVAGSYTTCYGDLYQWGSVNTLYDGFPYGSATGWEFKGTWKSGKTYGFVTGNREYTGNDATLPNANDVVRTKYPGTNWRMPTYQEFKDLADACGGSSNYNNSKKPGKDTNVDKGIYWCTDYDGVAGCLFCDGTNKLFFPAAGYGTSNQLSSAGTTGCYWSSSLCSSPTSNAHSLYFNSTYVAPESGNTRYQGYSVRRVSN